MLSRWLFCLLAFVLLAAPASAAQGAVPRDFVGIAADDVFAGDPGYRASALDAHRAALTVLAGVHGTHLFAVAVARH